MIRWRFVITRLIVVVAVLALLCLGLGPVAQYATVKGLQSATGAKVEIGKTQVGLFPPRVQYNDVRVADPRDDKEMRDALSAETIELVIDGDAFLHRRWVARDGRITGLQIGAERETSGHLEPREPESASDGTSMLSELLKSTTDNLGEQAEDAVGALETVRRSKEIRSRWENEYETLTARARDLEKRIRDIRDQARGIDNPLRDWPELERTLNEARQVRNELLSVRQAIDALPEQLQADLVSLDEAKRIDLAKVDKYVPGDLSGADEFGVDIITDAVRDQIAQVKSYLDGGRTLANYTVVAPESERVRGVDYDLELNDRPSIMIRRCEVGGLMRAGGDVYAITGVVENMTPSPERLEEPTRARLRLEGPDVLRVEYVRDRRQGIDVDLVTLHWPEMDAKPMQLGNSHDAGIAIAGGRRELWVQIRTEGDRVSGRFVSKQTGVNMDLSVKSKYASSAAATSLRDSLAAVDRIEIDANFNGTWKDLNLQMNSNLGQVMRRATQDAINGQLQASKQKVAAQIEREHAKQTLQLRQWLGSQAGEARELLAIADHSVEEISEKVLSGVGDADTYLGSRLRKAIEGRLR